MAVAGHLAGHLLSPKSIQGQCCPPAPRRRAVLPPCGVLPTSPPSLRRPSRGALDRPPRIHAVSAETDAVIKSSDELLPRQPYSSVVTAITAPYRAYADALKRYPLVTKSVTAFVGFMLGDLIAQSAAHMHHLDLARTGRLGLYGLLVDAPVGAAWYDLLDKHVFPDSPTAMKTVLTKTLLDQFVYSTVMTVVYFTVIKLLEGHPELIKATLQDKFWPTMMRAMVVWWPAHILSFTVVPTDWRILYNNTVTIAWLSWLSLLTHSAPGSLPPPRHK